MQAYSGGRLPLIHIDVWRMKDSNELETIGWDELLTDQSGVIVVEWAQKITDALPQKRIQIQISFSNSKDNSTMSSSQDSRTATIIDQRVLPA
jgi:tRNA threonylcarbamoyl adenosine modification protein YjeE